MSKMQAIFIEKQQLLLRECERPTPKKGEVLIKTAYAGLNRADIFQREGSYAGPEGTPNIPGLEVSGHIAALGEEAGNWREGDAVCALLAGGGYGEYVLARADHCLPVPKPLSLEQAAAVPECAATIWMALMDEAQLQAGERVLLHGGASGVGTTGIQMLRAYGCEVFATAGNGEKLQLCERLGAVGVNYKEHDFVSVVKEAGGVDVVLDIVGGDYIDRSLQCLKMGGRLVSLAFLQGSQVQVNAGRVLMKRLRWQGATLRARSDAQKAEYMQHLQQTLWPWIAQGWFVPVVDSVFALADAAAAQEKMQKYLHCGKILLKANTA